MSMLSGLSNQARLRSFGVSDIVFMQLSKGTRRACRVADNSDKITIEQNAAAVEKNHRLTSERLVSNAARSRGVAMVRSPAVPCLSAASARPVATASAGPRAVRLSPTAD